MIPIIRYDAPKIILFIKGIVIISIVLKFISV